MLNYIATDLQLYKIFKIMPVSCSMDQNAGHFINRCGIIFVLLSQ